jgi:hypothetical protein
VSALAVAVEARAWLMGREEKRSKGLFARQSIIIINGLKGRLVALSMPWMRPLLRYDYDDDDVQRLEMFGQ